MRKLQNMNRLMVIIVAAASLLWTGFAAGADEIDRLLQQSEVQLNIGSGTAKGKLLGRNGNQLNMKLGDVEYAVQIDQLKDSPQTYFERSARLLSDGKYRRAAVFYGLARLIEPTLADAAMEQKILAGIPHEKTEVENLREQRIKAEQEALEADVKERLKNACPMLFKIYHSKVAPLPSFEPNPSHVLKQWESAAFLKNESWEALRTIRDSSAQADQRLRDLEGIIARLPDPDTAPANMKVDIKRLETIIHLFIFADAGMTMDRALFEATQKRFEEFHTSFTPAIERKRKEAREILLEQLVPSKRVVRVRRGNLYEEKVENIKRDEIMVEKLQDRLNAPFIKERRADSGYYFTTEDGDEVFVPVTDWKEFDDPEAMAPTAEEEFLKQDRIGLAHLKKALKPLALAWGTNPNDPDLNMALQVLEIDAMAIYGGKLAPAPEEDSSPTEPAAAATQPPVAAPFGIPQ